MSLIIRSSFTQEGIRFFTPDDYSQQLAYMNRPKGYVIKPHIHNMVKRKVELTQEVLVVRTGRIRIDFYDNDQNYLESKIVNEGDIIMLAHGGHGLEMLEESQIIEIKQGPYSEVLDKTRFDPIDKSKIKLGKAV
jgi:hypothetical protein